MRYISTERMKRKARKSTALIVLHVNKHTELNTLLLNKTKPQTHNFQPPYQHFPSLLCHRRRGKGHFNTTIGLLRTYPGGHARDMSTPPILPIKHCFKQGCIPSPLPSPLPPSVVPKLCISDPVCLSPMISSLCPLPMGTKLSTALMPVCMGSRTEIRGMMPGALVPTRALLSVTIGPYNEEEDIQLLLRLYWLCKVVCRE